MTLRASGLLRIELTVADLARAERFYVAALGFEVTGRGEVDAAYAALLGADRIDEVVLRRGNQTLALQAFYPDGKPYPAGSTARDPAFQHFAMPTPDIAQAFARLDTFAPTTISRAGPQTLPQRSGGATAFKFRDPDGHPLELIEFPDQHSGGIDHSAIVVRDAERSIDFYRGILGLRLAARQFNTGPEQDALDGLAGATADVIELTTAATSPHLELLAYRPPATGSALRLQPRDIAATRLVLSCAGLQNGASEVLHDPDDHILILVPD